MTIFLNWTKSGHLSSSKQQNIGSGLPFVEERARLWHSSSVTIVLKLASAYGTRYRKSIVPVIPLAISGMPTRRFFLKKRIAVLAKTLARRITWNVGIAPYGSGSPDMFAKLCRSRKLNTCTILWHVGLLSNTTWLLLLIMYFEPLPNYHPVRQAQIDSWRHFANRAPRRSLYLWENSLNLLRKLLALNPQNWKYLIQLH